MKKPEATNEARLLAAAVRCFAKLGVEKTFIEDIAREAGLSRQTAYRTFKTRDVLLEKVAERSIRLLEIRLQPMLRKYKTFQEALLNGIPICAKEARGDKMFIAVLNAMGEGGRDQYILNPSQMQIDHNLAVWGEVIDNAIATGELRSALTKQDVGILISWMLGAMIFRDDLSKRAQVLMLKKFFLPALVSHEFLDESVLN